MATTRTPAHKKTSTNGAARKRVANPEETKRQKFVRLINDRCNKAVKIIDRIGNLGSAQYERNEGDVENVRKLLQEAVNDACNRLGRVKQTKEQIRVIAE